MDYSSYLESYTRASSNSSSFGSILNIVLSLALVLGMWFLFEKAGEAGWQSIVPLYSTWVLFRLVYGSGWKCLLLLVPILNIAVYISFCFRLPQAFGKGAVYGVGMLFLPPVFELILAFGDAKYTGPATYKFL